MDYGWFDLVGNVGVLLMVIAYLLLQNGKDIQLGGQLFVFEHSRRGARDCLADVSFQLVRVLDGSVLAAD